jgi:hypothetical protein
MRKKIRIRNGKQLILTFSKTYAEHFNGKKGAKREIMIKN